MYIQCIHTHRLDHSLYLLLEDLALFPPLLEVVLCLVVCFEASLNGPVVDLRLIDLLFSILSSLESLVSESQSLGFLTGKCESVGLLSRLREFSASCLERSRIERLRGEVGLSLGN